MHECLSFSEMRIDVNASYLRIGRKVIIERKVRNIAVRDVIHLKEPVYSFFPKSFFVETHSKGASTHVAGLYAFMGWQLTGVLPQTLLRSIFKGNDPVEAIKVPVLLTGI